MEETLESVLKACLRSRFGYDSFRGQQLQVMLHLLHGRDAFCLMATGGGKSLIYQLPAIALRDKGVRVVSVVISPLIAIMQDQVESLKAVGVSAVALGGSATHQEEQRAMEGDYPIVFASPEKAAIWQHGFKRLMETSRVISLAVDESHCVAEWGIGFRPLYRQLGSLRKILPGVPCLAITATATKLVQTDIISNLKLEDPFVVASSFNRKNLRYAVFDRAGGSGSNDLIRAVLLAQARLAEIDQQQQQQQQQQYAALSSPPSSDEVGWVQAHAHAAPVVTTEPSATTTTAGSAVPAFSSSSAAAGAGIAAAAATTTTTITSASATTGRAAPSIVFQPTLVYAMTIADVETLVKALQECVRLSNSGVRAAAYHSRMPINERRAVAAAFAGDELQIVVATSAFGMGIHKSNIRVVVHHGFPQSLEQYYQQTGRAGRDGRAAECFLLYNRNDEVRSWNIEQYNPTAKGSGAAAASLSAATAGGGGIAAPFVQKSTASFLEELSRRIAAEADPPAVGANAREPPSAATSAPPADDAARWKVRYDLVKDYIRGCGGCRRSFLLAYFGEGPGGKSITQLRASERYCARPMARCCDLCDARLLVREESEAHRRLGEQTEAGTGTGAGAGAGAGTGAGAGAGAKRKAKRKAGTEEDDLAVTGDEHGEGNDSDVDVDRGHGSSSPSLEGSDQGQDQDQDQDQHRGYARAVLGVDSDADDADDAADAANAANAANEGAGTGIGTETRASPSSNLSTQELLQGYGGPSTLASAEANQHANVNNNSERGAGAGAGAGVNEQAGRQRVDLGMEVLLLLRAIQETTPGGDASSNHQFGLSLPVSVLLGSHEKSVQQRLGPHYTSLSTFGQGQAHGKGFWLALCHQLAEQPDLPGMGACERLVDVKFVRTRGSSAAGGAGGGGGFSYSTAVLTASGQQYLRKFSQAMQAQAQAKAKTQAQSNAAGPASARGERGETGQRGCGWCFTLNNYSEGDVERLGDLFSPGGAVAWVCFQPERAPRTDNPHLQGAVWFAHPHEFASARRVLGEQCNLEVMQGSCEQSRAFCSKLESRDTTAGFAFSEFGVCPAGGDQSRGSRAEAAAPSIKPVHFLVPSPELAALLPGGGPGGSSLMTAGSVGLRSRVPSVPAVRFVPLPRAAGALPPKPSDSSSTNNKSSMGSSSIAARSAMLQATRSQVLALLVPFRDATARRIGASAPQAVLSTWELQQLGSERVLVAVAEAEACLGPDADKEADRDADAEAEADAASLLCRLGVLDDWKVTSFGAELMRLLKRACQGTGLTAALGGNKAKALAQAQAKAQGRGQEQVEGRGKSSERVGAVGERECGGAGVTGSPASPQLFRPLPIPPAPPANQIGAGTMAPPQGAGLYRPTYLLQQPRYLQDQASTGDVARGAQAGHKRKAEDQAEQGTRAGLRAVPPEQPAPALAQAAGMANIHVATHIIFTAPFSRRSACYGVRAV